MTMTMIMTMTRPTAAAMVMMIMMMVIEMGWVVSQKGGGTLVPLMDMCPYPYLVTEIETVMVWGHREGSVFDCSPVLLMCIIMTIVMKLT